MTDSEHLLSHVVGLTPHLNLAAGFLLVFSRFEFALKDIGYSKQKGDQLVVNWRKFADDHGASFDPHVYAASLDPLLSRPPWQQARTAPGGLTWVPEAPISIGTLKLRRLLDLTYRVRNNLFHGGKWPHDVARDSELLQASMAVLAMCMDLSTPLLNAFMRDA